MYQHILLPLDGSAFSEAAHPFALALATAAGAELHTVQIPVPDNTSKPGDYVAAQLKAYIAEHGINLVVMSTHGRSGLRRAVLGSVAEHVVRTTNVPVILLKDNAPALHRILVALDGSAESESTLAPALELARLTGAKITLVRVATAPFDIVATIGSTALHEYLERGRVQALEYLNEVVRRMPAGTEVAAMVSDRPAEGVLRCQDDVGADLIAMATHGRTGWSRIAVGSVAESVLHRSPVPVMVMRAPTATEQQSGSAAALQETGV